ncbi:MAG: hypothetical protein RIQ81_104 [Pseudomonadota bacterium]
MILHGDSDYFLARALGALMDVWRRTRGADSVNAVDADSTSADELLDLVSSQGLFDDAQLVAMRRCEKKGDTGKLLAAMPPSPQWSNHLVMTCQKAALPAEFSRQVTRLGGKVIAVAEPLTNQDFLAFIQTVAGRLRMRMTPEAEHLILASCGRDAVLLDNELRRLSLVYVGDGREIPDIGTAEVAAVVGILREDEVFRLDELLTNRRYGQVEVLLHQFIARGESALAVTGVLARHARNALHVKDELERRGSVDVPGLAGRLHVPQAVVRNLVRYVSGIPRSTFDRALAACGKADLDLKTSGLPDGLALSRIVECFQH